MPACRADGGLPLVALAADLAAWPGAGDGRRTALSRAQPAARASLPPRLRDPFGYPRGSMGYDAIVLASASARRSQLLHQIGVRHRIVGGRHRRNAAAGREAARLRAAARRGQGAGGRRAARRPAGRPGARRRHDRRARTDGSSASRPTRRNASRCSRALAGRTHAVLTAVALWHEGRLRQVLDTSYVTFRAIDADEGRRYWASGEPAGKAGGYAIQGLGAVFVARIEGSFSGVMGLPLFETAALLDAAGVRRWQAA